MYLDLYVAQYKRNPKECTKMTENITSQGYFQTRRTGVFYTLTYYTKPVHDVHTDTDNLSASVCASSVYINTSKALYKEPQRTHKMNEMMSETAARRRIASLVRRTLINSGVKLTDFSYTGNIIKKSRKAFFQNSKDWILKWI